MQDLSIEVNPESYRPEDSDEDEDYAEDELRVGLLA